MVPARLPRPTVRSMASESEPVEFTSTDDQLAQMVAVADLPSLLATLAHDCSAPELLEATLYLDPTKHHEPHGGWTPSSRPVPANWLSMRWPVCATPAGQLCPSRLRSRCDRSSAG